MTYTEYIELTPTSRLAVRQDEFAEDPRGWVPSVDVLRYNTPRYNSSADDLGDCKTILGTVFTVVYGNTGDDDLALKVALRYKSVFNIWEDIETRTLQGYSQGDWVDAVAVAPHGYGTAAGHLDEYNAWLWGDVSEVMLERKTRWIREDTACDPFTEEVELHTWEYADAIGGSYLDHEYTAADVALEHFPLTEEETEAAKRLAGKDAA